MKDAVFKRLKHPIGRNRVASLGMTVDNGYKPDATVRSADGTLRFILESEQKTDRKAFLGDVLKAEKFAEAQNAQPELIIIMHRFSNTTVKQIAAHLAPYARWLADKQGGTLNVAAIQVLSDEQYLAACERGVELGSAAFRRIGHLAWSGSDIRSSGPSAGPADE